MGEPDHQNLPFAGITPQRSAVSWRSVGLGLVGVSIISILTPFNDYALNNTPMVGNNLPLSVVLLTFTLAILINGPLSRFKPRLALSAGEMTVLFSMMLVACAVPSAGLLRYLPGMLITPLSIASSSPEAANLIGKADLPWWLFPSFTGETSREWSNDPLVSGFVTRAVDGLFESMRAWVVPVLAWAGLIFPLYAALLFIVVLLRRQWVENERLAFPLAQVGLSLVEVPAPGRFFNQVMSRRSFWIAFGVVFAFHLINGLSNYFPTTVPKIPLGFDFKSIFTEAPLMYAGASFKAATLFFIVIGATYFIPSVIAFSLWFFYVLLQVWAMAAGTMTGETHLAGIADQHAGAIAAFAISIAWIGRHHWALILRQAFRGRRPDEPADPYLPYPIAFWGLVLCVLIMIAWLMLAGCSALASSVIVFSLLLLFVVLTRVIAESGLIHGMLIAPLTKPWELLSFYGAGKLIPIKSMYLTSVLNGTFYDFREVASVYASHALKIADQTIPPKRNTGVRLLAAMGLALAVAYFLGWGSTLWTEYTYASTQDVSAVSPINNWGASTAPKWFVIDATSRYDKDNFTASHDPATHVAIGFVITAALSALRLYVAWWPLHPIGFLMMATHPMTRLWFSILIGWLVKSLILRLGGSSLYVQAKPFFLGLIVGESLAAGFWMVSGIALNLMNIEYRPVVILPS
jgi:hypothetical protein